MVAPNSPPQAQAHLTPKKPMEAAKSFFLQIWSLPATADLHPKYVTRHFTDDEKTDK